MTTITNTQDLLAALAAGAELNYLCFWGHTPSKTGAVDKSCLSQWYPAAFRVDGVTYPTAEHYMMARKAALFGDADIESRIIATKLPADVKKLGRQVANFDTSVWAAQREAIVYDGNLAKFSQHTALRNFLLASGDNVIVEASPVDPIWGAGLAENAAAIADPSRWRGLNLLGFTLMKVRDALS